MSTLAKSLTGAVISAAVVAVLIQPPVWAILLIAGMAWATLLFVMWEENQPRYKRGQK